VVACGQVTKVTPFDLPWPETLKPHATHKLHGSMLYRTRVIANGSFTFCSYDNDLDPMTFVYKPDPYSLEIYCMCKYELLTSRLSKVIFRQTDRHD